MIFHLFEIKKSQGTANFCLLESNFFKCRCFLFKVNPSTGVSFFLPNFSTVSYRAVSYKKKPCKGGFPRGEIIGEFAGEIY